MCVCVRVCVCVCLYLSLLMHSNMTAVHRDPPLPLTPDVDGLMEWAHCCPQEAEDQRRHLQVGLHGQLSARVLAPSVGSSMLLCYIHSGRSVRIFNPLCTFKLGIYKG